MMEPVRDFFQSEEMAETRPFYLIITALLLGVSALTLFQSPVAVTAGRLALFLTLLTFHLILHWASAHAVTHSRWRLIYLPLQAVVASALALLSQRPELTLALFATLVAETLGLYGLRRLAAAGVIGYISVMIGAFLALGGLPLLAEWTGAIVPTMALLILFMILFRRQADARQRTQEVLVELEAAHSQLAEYAAQVEALTLAGERQRMARELHDTLSQGVAALVLQLEAVNAHLEKGSVERAGAIVELSLKRARSTLAESRAAIDDLRLEERLLSESVQRWVAHFTQATGIPCHLELALPAETMISSTIVDHAERIVGESLSNVARHAQADNVWLNLRQEEQTLTIRVCDDGVGLDVEKAIGTGHYGLLGMRERARLVGGSFSLQSEPGQGCRLAVSLPLEAS